MIKRTQRHNMAARAVAGALLCAILAASCSQEERPPVREATLTDSRLTAEATQLKGKLRNGFIVEVATPFIIAGDISPAEFAAIKQHTILKCYHAFYSQFFTVKPSRPIKVFLFKDDASYRKHARKLFGDEPSTPYGYYKSSHRSLVMNIATGTGTLVHEMTHALIEYDFPQVPAWFNEGLGSLFEQCHVTPRGLKGLINWRLPILRKAIRESKLTGLRGLTSTTTSQFYRDERGTHYAEARYFCMYMQERGLLEKFYKTFKTNFKEDPTGAKTIEKLFGKKLEEIEKEWLRWVNRLPPFLSALRHPWWGKHPSEVSFSAANPPDSNSEHRRSHSPYV